MTALLCEAPGLSTTLQDLGRLGYQHLGVPTSGALDRASMRLVNALVGNRADTAVLEFFYRGPRLKVIDGPVRVAAGASARVRGTISKELPPWTSFRLGAGDTLDIGRLAHASCSYLAVEGGFAVPSIMGSRSTYTRAGIGGLHGRALAAGDLIPLNLPGASERDETCLGLPPTVTKGPIRVVLGPQQDHFQPASVHSFLSEDFVVSHEADRIGIRLEGPKLIHSGSTEILSEGTANGSVQVPGSGLPIILLADRQTAGGYPKIATIISADLPRAGTLPPGSLVRFKAVTAAEGVEISRRHESAIEHALAQIGAVAESGTISELALMEHNIIGGVVSATWDD
jgi:biotin-dependent carboxylase-like uncharacterized protein